MKRTCQPARTIYWPFVAVKLLVALPTMALAQTSVDSGALMRETQQQPIAIPALPKEPQKTVAAPVTGPKVVVRSFEIDGSTQFDNATLDRVLADFVGRELSFSDLQAAADRISLHYRAVGLHALAILPEQDLKDGRVRIRVIEGKLGRLRLSPPERADQLPLTLVERIVNQGQSPGKIVDVDALERATLIANDVPGLKVTTVLSAGTQAGETDIETKIEATPLIAGNLSTDNFDPRSTGREKVIGNLSLNNPLGLGDQLQLSAQASAGKRYASAAMSFPLAANGLRAGMNTSHLRYSLQGSFAVLGGKGTADTWGANLSYPVLRSQMTNVIAQFQHTQSHLVNDSNAGNVSDNRTRSTTLSLNFNHMDGWGGGGVSMAGIGLVQGKIDLAGNAAFLATDQATLKRNGDFTKTTYNLARLQRITGASQFWLSFNGQLAGKNLDPGEEFSLGGPNGVRAYPALEASGDQGNLLTVEYRQELPWHLRGKVFYDQGHIRVNHDNSFAGAPARNAYVLDGVGVGLDWSPHASFNLRSSLAWRLKENPVPIAGGNDNDGSKRIPQFWLYAQYDF